MLSPADEFPHEPPSPIPPGWQENWYLLGWDAERSAGFSLHLGRIPLEERLTAKACVLVGDAGAEGEVAVAVAAIDAPLGAELKAPGLEIDIDPFRSWRVSLDTVDRGGRPLGFDVAVESLLPPVDWREALTSLMASGTERDHYEVGARFSGRLTFGATAVDAAGLLVRDHTWGVRGYGALDEAWWTPMVFADPDPAYFTGVSVRYGERWIGTGIAVDSSGRQVIPDHVVEVTGGEAGRRAYRSAVIRSGPAVVSATAAAHAHVPYPEWAEGFWLNDAFCSAEWNGRRGFGIVELNRIDR
ncbi:MAG: hypothetical protein AB1679_22270 [Actinomycetota bacterium]|jgi:hypothetical protein